MFLECDDEHKIHSVYYKRNRFKKVRVALGYSQEYMVDFEEVCDKTNSNKENNKSLSLY